MAAMRVQHNNARVHLRVQVQNNTFSRAKCMNTTVTTNGCTAGARDKTRVQVRVQVQKQPKSLCTSGGPEWYKDFDVILTLLVPFWILIWSHSYKMFGHCLPTSSWRGVDSMMTSRSSFGRNLAPIHAEHHGPYHPLFLGYGGVGCVFGVCFRR